MSEVTAFVGRTLEGDKVYVTLTVEKFNRTVQTVNHEIVTGGVRLSVSGFVIGKGQRTAHGAGQCLDVLANVSATAPGWKTHDVGSLLTVWRRWHLNDMRAGCGHMNLPDDTSYDARKGITCPVSVVVKRDGKVVSPILADEDAAYAWLLHHQGMSVAWALAHEGYSIEPGYKYGQAWLYEEPPADVVAEFERLMALPTGKVPTTY